MRIHFTTDTRRVYSLYSNRFLTANHVNECNVVVRLQKKLCSNELIVVRGCSAACRREFFSRASEIIRMFDAKKSELFHSRVLVKFLNLTNKCSKSSYWTNRNIMVKHKNIENRSVSFFDHFDESFKLKF